MDRDTYEAVNRTGTELLLANARRCGVTRFVYTSSPSVVFAGEDQCGVDEKAPYDFGWMESNRAFYSYTKACAEQAVLAANCDALRTCALRPHLIWGPGDTHLVPRLLARARTGTAASRRRRREPCRHHVCRECCGRTFAGGRCARATEQPGRRGDLAGWEGVLYQPGRAGELLAVDR